MIKLAASLASGPLTDLRATVHDLESAGADVLHFDIEDGSFVPVMNLGVKIIRELRPLTKLPFDVHLMMVNPEWLLPELAHIGVQAVSVHYEACPYPRRTLGMISQLGMRAGLAFNPASPIPALDFCLPYLAFVVVLSTEPEMGDCPFLPFTLAKVAEGRRQAGLQQVEWVMDGGISPRLIQAVAESGVDMAVVGRSVFGGGAIKENLLVLRQSAALK